MRKNLYYFNWQLQQSLFGVVLDDIAENYENDEIFFVSCKGSLLPCWSNKLESKSKCKVCRITQKSAFSHQFKKVTQIYIDDYATHKEVHDFFDEHHLGDYNSVKEIKGLEFRDISIGYGALSTYISATRNLEPKLDKEFKTYFNKLLKTEIFIKVAIDRIIEKVAPEVISMFNGRTHDTRSVYETAINYKLPLRGIETVVKSPLNYQRRIFENALPHDIDFQTISIEETWSKSLLGENDKIELASSFYQKRRDSQLVRDVKVYTKHQKKNKLPENWSANKRNIVIFNSSEDEFAAIGKEWDVLRLFESQEKAVEEILKRIQCHNIHFYLRIHPNLIDVNYGYHKRLYLLEEKFENITVIPANSDISTYSLMDNSEKVIVFGSSTGVEANFARKPVILLGGAFYYYLNVSYNPTQIEDMVDLILEKGLSPKPIIGALKFGFYLMNMDSYSKKIKYNAHPIKIGNRTIGYSYPHLKILNSSALFKFYMSFYKRIKFTFTDNNTSLISQKEK